MFNSVHLGWNSSPNDWHLVSRSESFSSSRTANIRLCPSPAEHRFVVVEKKRSIASTYQTMIHQWTARLRTAEKHCSLSSIDAAECRLKAIHIDKLNRLSTTHDKERRKKKRIDPSVRPFSATYVIIAHVSLSISPRSIMTRTRAFGGLFSSYRHSSVDRAVKWRWKESPDDSKKASSLLFCPSSNENVRRGETHRLASLASINLLLLLLLLPSIDIFFSSFLLLRFGFIYRRGRFYLRIQSSRDSGDIRQLFFLIDLRLSEHRNQLPVPCWQLTMKSDKNVSPSLSNLLELYGEVLLLSQYPQ